MGLHSCTIEWRVRKAGLFLRLANAPAGSWPHLAFIVHHHLQTDWFKACLSDICLPCPGVRFLPTFVGPFPHLSCTGSWNDTFSWISYLAFGLPHNFSGARYRPPVSAGIDPYEKLVKNHVRQTTHNLRIALKRAACSEIISTIQYTNLSNDDSKLKLLAHRLLQPGPSLDTGLDFIKLPNHLSAFSSFFCGGWFLARYAHNYFAKLLLPSSSQLDDHSSFSSGQICLACWIFRRRLHFEDEYHVLFDCPEYSHVRDLSLPILYKHRHLSMKICSPIFYLLIISWYGQNSACS